jgi:carbon-monoxide dehydrogenase medium subunit
MPGNVAEWLAPVSLEEALELRARYADDATIVAGGTFIGILMSQRLIMPAAFLSIRNVHGLSIIEREEGTSGANDDSGHSKRDDSGQIRIGAMVTHRDLERSELVQRDWPVLAYTFSLIASPRVRNQATVGGVLADADYASDPPAIFNALNASVVAHSKDGGKREIPVEELITDYYETSLRADELLTEVCIPYNVERAVYRKFRTRSSEDRPCVAVAAAQVAGKLRVVVGAVAGRPQYFPSVCALADGETLNRELAIEIGRKYAESIDAITDARGSAKYRKRIIAIEVRRALEELIAMSEWEGGQR